MSATKNDLTAFRNILPDIFNAYQAEYSRKGSTTFEFEGKTYVALDSASAGRSHPHIPCLRLSQEERTEGTLRYRGTLELLAEIPTEPYHTDENDLRRIHPILVLMTRLYEEKSGSQEGSVIRLKVNGSFFDSQGHTFDFLGDSHLVHLVSHLLGSVKKRTWNFDPVFHLEPQTA